MKIKPSPQRVDGPSSAVEVIDENTLLINGETYEFPVELVQFDPVGPVLSAFRDVDGVLNVVLLFQYGPESAPVWETKIGDGIYRGMAFEDAQVGAFR